jgi:thiamine biosynthesis lipoprotein
MMTVLTLGQELHSSTKGTFDITARPLIEIWRRAGKQGLLPSRDDLIAARAESNWSHIHLAAEGVSKELSSTRVDVDGIAKGYAIDQATAVLQRSGAPGGMVEIGGDLRLFGETPDAKPWNVAIRSPFEEASWAEIEILEGAVCSSGDYARFIEIEGRRYSHIIDPRSGRPTEESHAVTVVGTDAATADAWATALSILGVAGLDLLNAEAGLEAMVVTGGPDDYEVRATPGFRRLLVRADFDLQD